MNSYVKIEKPKEEFWEIAEKAIKNNWINYLPENVDVSSQIEETIEEEKELTSIGDLDFSDGDNFEKKLDIINRLDNKEFIFNLLNISVEYGIFDDLYPILINENLCKEYFMQKYPVLVESTNEVDKLRYYQKDLFEYEGKSYYVTNDWYQDTSKNTRKNRTPFILMVKEMVLRS